jgi:hypothetical protein
MGYSYKSSAPSSRGGKDQGNRRRESKVRQTRPELPRSPCIIVRMHGRMHSDETNARHELQVRHSNRSCLLSQRAILKGPANKTLPIPESALHANGLVTSAANSAARLSDFHLFFSPRPSRTLPCPPDFGRSDATTSTARFHAGRRLRP